MAGVGVAVTVALHTYRAPLVTPSGVVAWAAELTGASSVASGTLADLDTEGGIFSLGGLRHGAVH